MIHIDTPAFNGDVLAYNNEICNELKGDERHPNGGMSLSTSRTRRCTSTSPSTSATSSPTGRRARDPQRLRLGRWRQGVRGARRQRGGPGRRHLDITDPRNPVLIADTTSPRCSRRSCSRARARRESSFHDVVVKQIAGRYLMLLSYWDGGYVVLDVTDPRTATYVADSDFADPDPEAPESGLTVSPRATPTRRSSRSTTSTSWLPTRTSTPTRAWPTNVDDGTTFTAIQGSDVPGDPNRAARSTAHDGLRRPRLRTAIPPCQRQAGPARSPSLSAASARSRRSTTTWTRPAATRA